MTELEAAYIAGIIDGEGTIGMFANAAPSRPRPATMARVKIGMSDSDLIDWLYELVPGGTRSHWRGKHTTWKTCHVVQWNGRKALMLLRTVRPYLRLKGRQADILLEWVELSNKTQAELLKNNVHERQFPPEILQRRDAMINELHALNQRGRLPSLPTS